MSGLRERFRDSRCDEMASMEFAKYLDNIPESLSHLRSKFAYPTRTSLATKPASNTSDDKLSTAADCIYFCGNSLGLMPRDVRALVLEELDIWAGRGVLGHFDHPLDRPWKDIQDLVQAPMARIVGAKQSEVSVMGSLTSNLHTLMSTFYRPVGKRTKIIFEAKAFPSDQYAFASQARLHGLDPEKHLIAVRPRQGEYTLLTEDILALMRAHGDEIALVMFAGIQYYTGQFFDVSKITQAGHDIGAVVGWDLAHAVGNVPLALHDWEVDFACWCNYKYMNAGPGAIAGIFVHESARYPPPKSEPNQSGAETPSDEKHRLPYRNRLAGWWGHNAKTRFQMTPEFDPIPGAAGFQLSNPSVLNVVSLLASLRVFEQTSMAALRTKSLLLTDYLRTCLESQPLTDKEAAAEAATTPRASFLILTPLESDHHGAQLSLLFRPEGQGVMERVMSTLLDHGVVADERQPDVIRLAPIPSYNTFEEVRRVASVVRLAVRHWSPTQSSAASQTKALTQTS